MIVDRRDPVELYEPDLTCDRRRMSVGIAPPLMSRRDRDVSREGVSLTEPVRE